MYGRLKKSAKFLEGAVKCRVFNYTFLCHMQASSRINSAVRGSSATRGGSATRAGSASSLLSGTCSVLLHLYVLLYDQCCVCNPPLTNHIPA